MKKFRPAAVPIATIDPYFNMWSFADCLYDDDTRHWTGARNSMVGMIKNGKKVWRFMGKVSDGEYYYYEPDVIMQTDVSVNPTITEYKFENEELQLTVRFITPLITDELELLSRPVSYIEYEAYSKTGENIEAYFDISAECAVNELTKNIKLEKSEIGIFCGNTEQKILSRSGDDLRIDWGYLHLLDNNAYFSNALLSRNGFIISREEAKFDAGRVVSVCEDKPVLAVIKKGEHGKIAIAYDDIKCIEYYGKHLKAYYTKDGSSFLDICKKALDKYDEVKKKCLEFDKQLIEKARKISEKYADIISLSYRQTIAAHKLCCDENGEILFISKECYSNGCAATLDITYPSSPLFLLLKPELVLAMLRPIVKVSLSDAWQFEFAPHDAGEYPKLNGQFYGYEKDDPEYILSRQMPIEESGNFIIMVYAACKALKDNSFAEEHKELMIKWCDYLVREGKNPQNQLCTDDFNGHLENNCNLSIKAIIAIYACGDLYSIQEYKDIAKEYAQWWRENAIEEDHSLLAFGTNNTWSLKYNMVWDKLLGFGLFGNELYKKEAEFYLTKLQKYGLPLDSRGDIAKLDWNMWVAVLCDNNKDRRLMIDSIWDMISETKQRVPMTDHYYVSTGEQYRWAAYRTWGGFQNRRVVGGLAILMLLQK